MFSTELGISSDTVVDVIDFNKDSHIPLPRLAVLIRCVNDVASEYNLLTKNCYWFAYVTAEALKKLYPEHAVSTYKSAGNRGTWNSLPVHFFFKDSKDMVKKVVEGFPVEWDEFITEVTLMTSFAMDPSIPRFTD